MEALWWIHIFALTKYNTSVAIYLQHWVTVMGSKYGLKINVNENRSTTYGNVQAVVPLVSSL